MTMPAHLGYVALALLVGGESIGLLVPGETALLAAAVLARQGGLDIWLVVAVAAVAAMVGDNLGYLIGRRGWSSLLLARGPWRPHRVRLLEAGRRFFQRRGAAAVFLGRWVPVARMTVAFLAGASGMRWRAFLRWNTLGAVAWAASVGLAGYLLGVLAETVMTSVTAAAVVVAVVAVLVMALRRLRARRAAVPPG
jgi:membrane-associated protein